MHKWRSALRDILHCAVQNRIEEWIREWRLNPAESRDLYLQTAALLRTNKVVFCPSALPVLTPSLACADTKPRLC